MATDGLIAVINKSLHSINNSVGGNDRNWDPSG